MISERMLLSPRPEYDRIAAATDRALSVSQGHYDDSWDALVNSRRGDALASVTTPTFVVAGAADGLLLANLRDFQRLPNATLHVFSRVGHGVHQEDPQPFIVMLRDFLEHGVVTAASLMEAMRQPAAAR
jgi:pimeloyl-ACP methyl ester carboxylesterase